MTQLQHNLKYLIYVKHMTNPTSLSRVTGVSQPTIKRILDGDSAEPRYSSLAKLARYFGVGVEELRSGVIDQAPVFSLEQQTAPPAQKQDALRFQTSQWLPAMFAPGKSKAMIEAFCEAMPANLKQYCRQKHYAPAWRRDIVADYRSERLTATVINESAVPERHLWRLAVMRQLLPTQGSHDWVLFVLREPGVKPKASPEQYEFSHLECAVMGLRMVLVSSLKDIVDTILEIEAGAFDESEEGSDDDKW